MLQAAVSSLPGRLRHSDVREHHELHKESLKDIRLGPSYDTFLTQLTDPVAHSSTDSGN
jgi:hypothetical protein